MSRRDLQKPLFARDHSSTKAKNEPTACVSSEYKGPELPQAKRIAGLWFSTVAGGNSQKPFIETSNPTTIESSPPAVDLNISLEGLPAAEQKALAILIAQKESLDAQQRENDRLFALAS